MLGHLTVQKVLPIKTESPRPLQKDLRRRSRLFYCDLQHIHRANVQLVCSLPWFYKLWLWFFYSKLQILAPYMSTGVLQHHVIIHNMCFVALIWSVKLPGNISGFSPFLNFAATLLIGCTTLSFALLHLPTT